MWAASSGTAGTLLLKITVLESRETHFVHLDLGAESTVVFLVERGPEARRQKRKLGEGELRAAAAQSCWKGSGASCTGGTKERGAWDAISSWDAAETAAGACMGVGFGARIRFRR